VVPPLFVAKLDQYISINTLYLATLSVYNGTSRYILHTLYPGFRNTATKLPSVRPLNDHLSAGG